MRRKFPPLKGTSKKNSEFYAEGLLKNNELQGRIYILKEENKRLLRANRRLVGKENAYYSGKITEFKAKLKTATNAIQSVINEPDLIDAGMLMFLTAALNKIKE